MDVYAVNDAIPADLLKQLVDKIRRNPSHPGRLLAGACENKSLSVREAAERIGGGSAELARVIQGRAPVTPELALRMEAAGWSSAEFWMRLQSKYDLAQARRAREAA